MRTSTIVTFPAIVILSGCVVFQPPISLEDAGARVDSGDPRDAGPRDAGTGDGGVDDAGADDAGTRDGGAADAGTVDAGSSCVVASIIVVDDCPGPVMINEVDGSGDDFIEIYNAGPTAVDISGYVITDDSGGSPDVADGIIVPDGVTLESRAFLYLWANLRSPRSGIRTTDCIPGAPPPCMHSSWGVAAAGEPVYLLDDRLRVICSFEYPSSVFGGEAFGRVPDGETTLCPTNPTPGETNQATTQR